MSDNLKGLCLLLVWAGAGFAIGLTLQPTPELPEPIRIHVVHIGGKIVQKADGTTIVMLPGGFRVREGDYYTFPTRAYDDSLSVWMEFKPPREKP